MQALGLARRAGRLAVGTRAVKEALRADEARVVVLAGDATENARRRVTGLAQGRRVPVVTLGNRETLGAAVGRGPVAVLAVTDAALAEGVLRRVAATPAARGRREGQDTGRRESDT